MWRGFSLITSPRRVTQSASQPTPEDEIGAEYDPCGDMDEITNRAGNHGRHDPRHNRPDAEIVQSRSEQLDPRVVDGVHPTHPAKPP
jgi:hypothetical protein